MQAKQQWKCPLEAVLQLIGRPTHLIVRPNRNVSGLSVRVIVASNQTIIRTCKNHVRVLWIGRNPATLTAADRVPIPFPNPPGGTARRNLYCGIVLLRTVGVIGKVIIQCNAGRTAQSVGCLRCSSSFLHWSRLWRRRRFLQSCAADCLLRSISHGYLRAEPR